jgi:hypothetical protein
MQKLKVIRERGRWLVQPFLSGPDICQRMRQNGHTIRGIARRYDLTMKRVREVRIEGVVGNVMVQDWLEITAPAEKETA